MSNAAVFTPDTLAERWGCSAETVRQMCKDGELQAFKVGKKLIRIPASSVEAYESEQIAAQQGTRSTPTFTPSDDPDAAIIITHVQPRRRRLPRIAK